MKKRFSTIAMTLIAITLFCCSSASAAFLSNWYLDVDGAGGTAPTKVAEYLDIVGPSYIVNSFTSPNTFTFADYGFFGSNFHSGGSQYTWGFTKEITGIFTATGSGTLGGALNFNGGTLDIYGGAPLDFATATSGGGTGVFYGANNGTRLATFSLTSGTGSVNLDALPNGQISLNFAATYLRPETWFDSSMNDLSLLPNINWTLGFATTNASYTQGITAAMLSEFEAFTGGLPSDYPPFTFFAGTNGQYRLAVVPEPSTLILLGGGLLGLGYFGRRRSRK